jgi:hypothetical protein
MRIVPRHLIAVLGVLSLAVAGLALSRAMAQRPPPVPDSSGFYYLAGAKYLRLPDCRGDECKSSCVTKAWIETAKVAPVASDRPSFLLKALLVPPTPREHANSSAGGADLLAVVAVVVLRVDSAKLMEVGSSLKVINSAERAVSLSFGKPLEAGTYAVLQTFPAAARYARVESAAGSLCFPVLDDKHNIIGPATPLGVFVVR